MMPLLYLALAAVAAYALNVFLIRFAHRMRALSLEPGNGSQSRWASRSKPLVGGLTFFLVFCGVLLFALIGGPTGAATEAYLPLLAVSILGFLIGLFDDAYNTKPLLKFGGQLLAGVLLVVFDVRVQLTDIYALDVFLTLLWVVGIMNSFNMMDNMDGVSATFSLVVLTTTAAVVALFHPGDTRMLCVLAGLIGAHLGFLALNLYPSKLFMGDTGSQFLGALLAYLGIVYFWGPQPGQPEGFSWRAAAVPMLAFGVTILDTLFVTVARLARRQSPFVGGRDHLSHHLVYFGVAEKWVPLVFATVGVLASGLAVAALLWHPQWSLLHNVGTLLFIVAVTVAFAYVYRVGARQQAERLTASKPATVVPSKPVERGTAKPAVSRVAAHA